MWTLFGFIAFAWSLFAHPAYGQNAPPQLRATLSSNNVAVGEPFTLTLEATISSGSPSPSDPQVSLPQGLSGSHPSVSTQSRISIVNGRVTQSTGINASWRLSADRAGSFTIPGPSVAWDGQRITANSVTLNVHSGPAPSQPSRRRPNPFDPFGMLGQLPGVFEVQEPEPEPEVPNELALDKAPDPYVFLRAVADKERAVVGEQVTLSVYLYSRTRIDWTDVHEPALTDFFRRDLMLPGERPEMQRVIIDGIPWRAQRVFHVAIFPLRAGKLDVGKQSASILGVGRGNAARGGVFRESQPLIIDVTEPPTDGRPAGYQLGDVGSYSMTASVEPRTVERDGIVAVTVTLHGKGNLPARIRVPMQSSVEWLEPETRESIETDGGIVRGSRTFTYLLRPKEAQIIDLGEFTLPYWDPDRQSYEIARAPLGTLRVKESEANANAEAREVHDPFASLGPLRKELAPIATSAKPITDSRLYWLGILGAPLVVLLGSGAERGFVSMRRRALARKNHTSQALERALEDAREAQRAGDDRSTASAIERAIYLAIEGATGLKARALLLNEIPTALESRGVDEELALRVKDVLAAAEALRFAPSSAPSAEDLLADTRSLCRKLRQSSKGAA